MNHNFTFMQINGVYNEGITQVNYYLIIIKIMDLLVIAVNYIINIYYYNYTG